MSDPEKPLWFCPRCEIADTTGPLCCVCGKPAVPSTPEEIEASFPRGVVWANERKGARIRG